MSSNGLNTALIGKYATSITTVVNSYLVPLVFTLALIVFLWGIARAYIISGGSESERAKGHQLILWAVVGFVVMLSIWGLVNLLVDFGGFSTGGAAPKPPTI